MKISNYTSDLNNKTSQALKQIEWHRHKSKSN